MLASKSAMVNWNSIRWGLVIFVWGMTASFPVFAESSHLGAGQASQPSAEPTVNGHWVNGTCVVTRPPSSNSSNGGDSQPCYSARCCPEEIAPAVCLSSPPDCSKRVCKADREKSSRPSPCPSSCPKAEDESTSMTCTYKVQVDDMLFDRKKTGPSECSIEQQICAEFRKDLGEPDNLEKKDCTKD